MKSVHVKLTPHVHEWLQRAAEADRRSLTSLVSLLVEDQLKEQFAGHEPYKPPVSAPIKQTADLDNLFDDEPTTTSEE
jgi:hypothetical protein